VTDAAFVEVARTLLGHRQVTDAVLLYVARNYGLALATLDSGLRALDVGGQDVVLIGEG